MLNILVLSNNVSKVFMRARVTSHVEVVIASIIASIINIRTTELSQADGASILALNTYSAFTAAGEVH